MQVLLELPYLLPRWCLDHIKFTLQGRQASENALLPQAFFDTIAVLLQNQKIKLTDVAKEVSTEFDRLPDAKVLKEMINNAADETAISGNVLQASNLNLDISACDCKVSEQMNLPQWPAMQLVLAMVKNGDWAHVHLLLWTFKSKFKFLLHRDVCMALAAKLENAVRQQTDALFPSGPLGPCILPASHSAARPDGLPVAAPFSTEVLQMTEV